MPQPIDPGDTVLMLTAPPVADRKEPMRMLRASEGGLSQATHHLLASRLKAVSLVIAAGWVLYAILINLQSEEQSLLNALARRFQFASTVILCGIAWRICVNCTYALQHLRIVEFLLFGLVAVQFLLMGLSGQVQAAQLGFLIDPIPLWLMLIFIYALFIPNSWQRAAGVIGAMVLLALLCMWLPFFFEPKVKEVLMNQPILAGMFARLTFGILFSAVAAVWGVHTINKLRVQAFEAQQVGQYRLKKLLGRGGMGEVHLAEHVLLRRPCAVKLILADKAGDPQALARFEREVQATARLTHWNTIEIYDYGRTDDGVFYYVMEYLPGLNLQQIVDQNGPLPPERVVHLLIQVCDALDEAHRRGMVHRDIKPANIFAASRGGVYDVVKLLDFGLVRDRSLNTSDLGLTQEGLITGSPLFMSPEQASGETPDARSDLYSVGIVGYFLLTGHVPFEYDKPVKVVLAHISEPPIPVQNRGPAVPDDLAAIIMKCLEKDPEQRYQTALELQRALQKCSLAGLWTREKAAFWWESYGCPTKRAQDAEVLEMVQC